MLPKSKHSLGPDTGSSLPFKPCFHHIHIYSIYIPYIFHPQPFLHLFASCDLKTVQGLLDQRELLKSVRGQKPDLARPGPWSVFFKSPKT